MPTLFRLGKLRFVIYLTDHDPAHVHVVSPDGEAKIGLRGRNKRPILLESYRLRAKDLAVALEAIESRQALLQRKWKELHGNRSMD